MRLEAPLTAEERAACKACAERLAFGALASALALLALAAVFGAAWDRVAGVALLLALLPVVAPVLWFALRVAIDARLFARLASGELDSLAALDRVLARVPGADPAKAGRPLAARIAGARRLYRLHWTGTLLLVVLALAAWWPH